MRTPFPSSVDAGQSIYIGDESIIQDSVVLHGLETIKGGEKIVKNQVEVAGKKHAVYVDKRVSMAHQSQAHGPAKAGGHSFIGIQALVFKAELGDQALVEPGAKTLGVKIKSGRYVPTGMIVTKQTDADALPNITDDYPFRNLNEAVVHVNTQLADGYNCKKLAGK
jgi:carbonic anhydrase/acetyltransferase-like protein (isoleucine patch superfamily)